MAAVTMEGEARRSASRVNRGRTRLLLTATRKARSSPTRIASRFARVRAV